MRVSGCFETHVRNESEVVSVALRGERSDEVGSAVSLSLNRETDVTAPPAGPHL